eukprot:6457958-Amphidinium_carterae.1
MEQPFLPDGSRMVPLVHDLHGHIGGLGLELLQDLVAATALRTLRVNYSAAMALRDHYCQLRAAHAIQTYRVMRAAVPFDVPDPAPLHGGRPPGPGALPLPLPQPLPVAATAAPVAVPAAAHCPAAPLSPLPPLVAAPAAPGAVPAAP